MISIVVPVYNTVAYLKQCFDSLANQTWKDIEIIIIDDGSTDGSASFCDAYAEKDKRFRVFHKVNEGLASARNDGIALSQGEYILFLDSDDWVELDLCEKVCGVVLEHNVDLVIFQYYRYLKNDKITKKAPFPREGIVSKDDLLNAYWPYVDVVAWNKLYKRELFDGIQYPVGCLCEDNAVTYRLVYKANHIYCMNAWLYHHRRFRPESIMNTKCEKLYSDQFEFEFQRLNDLKQWGYNTANDEINFAIRYLKVMGRQAKWSDQCETILRLSNSLSWKQRITYAVYRYASWLFELIRRKQFYC